MGWNILSGSGLEGKGYKIQFWLVCEKISFYKEYEEMFKDPVFSCVRNGSNNQFQNILKLQLKVLRVSNYK